MKPSYQASRWAVGALFFVSGLSFATWASRIPDISRKFGLSEGDLGKLLLAMPVGALIALPLAGWIIQRWGSRQVVFWASLQYVLTLPILGFADSLWVLAPALSCLGLGFNLVNIAVNTQAINVQTGFPKPIMASFHGLWSLAGFLGGAVGTLMIDLHQPPGTHFSLMAGLGILLVLIAHRFTTRQDSGTENSGSGFRRPDAHLIRLGFIALCGMICEGCMFDWSGVYFQRVVLADPAWVTSGYVACMSTMALGRFVADAFTHRFGAVPVFQASSAFIFTGILTAVLFPYLPSAILGFLLVGLGIASTVPLAYAAAGRSKIVPPGVALAMVTSIGFLGFLFGPPVIGMIGEAFGLKTSFALVALLGGGIALLATGMRIETSPNVPASQPEPLATL